MWYAARGSLGGWGSVWLGSVDFCLDETGWLSVSMMTDTSPIHPSLGLFLFALVLQGTGSWSCALFVEPHENCDDETFFFFPVRISVRPRL